MATTPTADLFNITAPAPAPLRAAQAAPPASDEKSFPSQLRAAPANSEQKAEAAVQDQPRKTDENHAPQSSSKSSLKSSLKTSPREDQEATNQPGGQTAAQTADSTERSNQQHGPQSELAENAAPALPAEPSLANEGESETLDDVQLLEAAAEATPNVEPLNIEAPNIEQGVAGTAAAKASRAAVDSAPGKAADAVLGAVAAEQGAALPAQNSDTTIDSVAGREAAASLAAADRIQEGEPTSVVSKEAATTVVAQATTATATAPNGVNAVETPLNKGAEKRGGASSTDAEAANASVEKTSENLVAPATETSSSDDAPKRHSPERKNTDDVSKAGAAEKAASKNTTAAQSQNIAIASLDTALESADPASETLPQERAADSAMGASATEANAAAATPNRTEGVASRASQALFGVSYRSDASQLNQADQSRFVQRVSNALRAASQRQDAEIRLRLSPPELGALKLQVRVEQGALVATLEAETQTARDLLLEQLPVLRERLAAQEIRIETFDVQVSDRQPNADQGSHAQQRNSREPRAQPENNSTERESEQTTAAPPRRGDGLLDVVA